MFRFKQFAVRQDRCPMKVGTDGVLLGAWAEVRPGDRRMLDVGTGTGLIALMLAQRSAAWITAVDIDVECATQAAENFAASPWADRLDAVSVAVQRYDPVEKFDLIVSNPPYYVDSLLSPDEGRNTARHAAGLPSACFRPADALRWCCRPSRCSDSVRRLSGGSILFAGRRFVPRPGAGCGVSLRSSARRPYRLRSLHV